MNITSKIFISILFSNFLVDNSVSAQLPSYLPTNGLVAWYPFNGNANDESGNGFNGTVYGASLAADRANNTNKAYYFDGTDDFIWASFLSPLNGSQQSSVSMWVYSDLNSPYGYGTIFGHWKNNGQYNGPIGEQITIINDGNINFSLIGGQGTNSVNQNVQAGLWQFITITFNGSLPITERISLYINGGFSQNILMSNAPAQIGVQATRTYIGAACGPDGVDDAWAHFRGVLDDIAIYNRALTQSEITALYTATATNTGGGTTSTSPAPPGIPYQAEVRNDSGEVLANANVNVRFTLHELTANGAVSYQETHALTTNELGLFAATIGAGTATQGTFASNNWAQTTKFLQVEVDTGNGYITMGNQQLMSVPYALYAANGPAGPQGPVGPQGEPGEPGTQGIDGKNSLIKTTQEPPGINCSTGGVKIETGQDTNLNGLLDSLEINHLITQFICNPNSNESPSFERKIGFSSNSSWQCPAGVYQIQVELWGAGGGGAQTFAYLYQWYPGGPGSTVYGQGGAGGAGGYNRQLINVTPGMNYPISIGVGGLPGTAQGQTGQTGGNTVFGDGIMYAEGGTGGISACCNPETNGSTPGVSGAVINYDYTTATQIIGTRTYIPTGYVVNEPKCCANGGAGAQGNYIIASQGENGYCIISF